MCEIETNLKQIRERMAHAAERSGRVESDVTLVAVSKTIGVECIQEAIAAGVTHFGENRVQEAQAKFTPRGMPLANKVGMDGITLHMIGSLQRNKARQAAALFDWIESVDRLELAWALDKAATERAGGPLPVLVEVNLSGEETKSGVSAEALPALADAVAKCEHLRGMGLMTIGRLGADDAELHRTFSTLHRLLEDMRRAYPNSGGWQHLSMGMTGDYEIAIEEGATIVRLGRAIFGERQQGAATTGK